MRSRAPLSRLLSPLLLCALLLACAFLAPHVRAEDSSSTGEGVPTGESSTGTVTPSESSSSGGDATTASSSSSSTGSADPGSTGSDSGSTGGVSGCEDANTALSLDYFVCGCRTLFNKTTFDEDGNKTTTEEIGFVYPGSSIPWEANTPLTNAAPEYPPWDNSLKSGNQLSNRIDLANNHDNPDFNSTFGQPVKVRGYPQCYGSTRSCLEQYDIVNHPLKQTGSSGINFCEQERKPGAEAPKFIKGDPSPPICLVFGGGNRLNKMRFYPKVDQFALLTIQDSFNGSTVKSTQAALRQLGHFGTSFQVELDGKQSPYRHRYGMVTSQECVSPTGADGEPDYGKKCTFTGGSVCTVVPFHTIVIHLKQGELDFIEWDDDDSLCNNEHSVDGNCAIEINECRGGQSYSETNTATSTDCDFKIYVSWAGTDSEGTYLSSSGRRLSQFRRWSLNAVYNQATSFDVGSLPTLPPEDQ